MISISEAFEIIEREIILLDAETVDLNQSVGRVLAREIRADIDLPPFDRSQMDGFALKTNDVEDASEKNSVKLKIAGESVAGKGFNTKIKQGEAVRIMTGARVPEDADAVQKKELAREFADANGEIFVEVFQATKAFQNIVLKGAEIETGEKVFDKGEIIGAQMIAPLASFGCAAIEVFQKPRVSILATGSEIVGVRETPELDQIRDSNSWSLKAFAENAGAIVDVLPRVKDDFENLKLQIAKAVGLEKQLRIADDELRKKGSSRLRITNSKTKNQSKIQNPKSKILILSGGVSVGDYDFTKPALRDLGAEIFFERVALRPGKPTVFARLNDTLIFGLPGNPVSVAVTFFLFARAALLKMQGAKNYKLKSGFAVLAQKIKGAKERDSFLPATIETNSKGKLVASVSFGGSSNFIAFARADCLVFVPRDENLEAGAVVKILFLPRK